MRRCVATTTGAMAEPKWKLLMLEPRHAQPARRAIHMNKGDFARRAPCTGPSRGPLEKMASEEVINACFNNLCWGSWRLLRRCSVALLPDATSGIQGRRVPSLLLGHFLAWWLCVSRLGARTTVMTEVFSELFFFYSGESFLEERGWNHTTANDSFPGCGLPLLGYVSRNV